MATDLHMSYAPGRNGNGNLHVQDERVRFAALAPVASPAAIPVSIISNSLLLCQALPVLLGEYLSLRIVANYPGEPGELMALPNPDGHLVLLDSGIGQEAAAAWIRRWGEQEHVPQVLLLELADDVEFILACVEAGVSGYTLRGASPRDIAQMILLLRDGKAACSPLVTAKLFARVRDLAARVSVAERSDNPLTQREIEVLEQVALGHSNKEIAHELVITLRTVKHHVHNILRKLGSTRRSEAAHRAIERGWIELPRGAAPRV